MAQVSPWLAGGSRSARPGSALARPGRLILRRATHCGRRASPKLPFIEHLLHAGPCTVPALASERWVLIKSTRQMKKPRLGEAKLLPSVTRQERHLVKDFHHHLQRRPPSFRSGD